MRSFWEIFRLEFTAFARSRALLILVVVALAWMFAAPSLFTGDGTAEGAREMCVRFSLGGVTTLLAVALLVTSAGSIAGERAAKRLQLTMVRPVRMPVLALGKIAALSFAGALVLAVALAVEAVRQDLARPCDRVLRPVLPSPAEEAAAMYDDYMADPSTPEAVKKAKRSVVMRLLTQRAIDHYQTVNTNDAVTWRFPLEAGEAAANRVSMRLRFTNMYEMRDEVRGLLAIDGATAAVSNITQAVVRFPFVGDAETRMKAGEVSFANGGERAVMLRPRKDVELLVRADDFAANLLRAYLELVAMLTLLVAVGVFLGAGLSRPVAVFTAVVLLALSEMSPSVVERYPDELETDRIDAIGLALARSAAVVTHPIGSLRPLSALAADECLEMDEVVRVFLADAVVLPLLLALLAAFVLPRKQE